MNGIPAVRVGQATYENLSVDCPWCGRQNVFNRASDLGTFEPVAGRDVACLHDDCRKAFRIVSDTVNNPHEMLIFDCYELLDRKHFMSCVLSVAQAYEVFFALYFRVELLYKPFAGDDVDQDLAELNRLATCLEARLERQGFTDMRALFLTQLVSGLSISNLAAADTAIAALPARPREPRAAALGGITDQRLVALLTALKKTRVHEMRNRVIHKRAYRPTATEAQDCVEEARAILFPLTNSLDLHEDINWYQHHPGCRTSRPAE